MSKLFAAALVLVGVFLIGYAKGKSDQPRCTYTQASKQTVLDLLWGSDEKEKR